MPADELESAMYEKMESHLPTELQILAGQLTDDAQHLAMKYASPSDWRSTPIVSRTMWMWIKRIAAAVAFMTVGAGTAALALHRWSPADVVANQDRTAKTAANEIAGGKKPILDPIGFDQRLIEVREVGLVPPAQSGSNLTEVQMLRIQVTAFEQVIRKLQDELAARDRSQAETQKNLEQLRSEIRQLQQQQTASRETAIAK